MKRNILLLSFNIILMICGCTNIVTNSENLSIGTSKKYNMDKPPILGKQIPECETLFTRKQELTYDNIKNCIGSIFPETLLPLYVDRILSHSPHVSKKTLSKMLIYIANGSLAEYKVIKKLVNAGASTQNVSLPDILYGNDIECDSVYLLLNRNLHLYKHKHDLNTKPRSTLNLVDGRFRREDLAYLADTSIGRSVCNKSIKKLISYNPELRDIQITYDGSTAAHQYLSDINHPDWTFSIAKLLIDKGNVNKRRFEDGYTPAHVLLLENRHILKNKPLVVSIMKEIIKKGGNLNIKSNYYYDHGRKKAGISPIEILSKKYPLILSQIKHSDQP